jgi:hypothetical protein
MTDTILDQEIEQEIPEIEEPAPEPPKFSGLMSNIFPDGTIEYDGEIGLPEKFPLTDAELAEVLDPGAPAVDLPPGPDYLAFWDALMVSTVYAAIREQSFINLPMNTLATEFIALIGDAKAGRANEAAIQQSMAAILTTGTFTAAQVAELQGALAAGHLDGIYTLTAAGPKGRAS